MNCCVSPFETVGLVGLSAIEVNAASATVRVSFGLAIPLKEAVINVVPVASVEASP